MGWLDSILNPGKAYDEAAKVMQQYYDQSTGQLRPYSEGGMQYGGQLKGAFDRLLNPAGLYDEWSKGYETSEAAKQAQEMARQGGLDAASSMGLFGSSPALRAIQAGTANIGLQDRQNYLNDLMNKYTTGLNLGQNIYGTGASAASSLANIGQQMGQNMAGIRYGQQSAPGNLFWGLASPAIGALGGGLANKLGWTGGGQSSSLGS